MRVLEFLGESLAGTGCPERSRSRIQRAHLRLTVHPRLQRDQRRWLRHQHHAQSGSNRPGACLGVDRATDLESRRTPSGLRTGPHSVTERSSLCSLNLAEADAFIASWDAKFTYNQWSPVTAIRAAKLRRQPQHDDRSGMDAATRHAAISQLHRRSYNLCRRGGRGA